LAERLLDDEKSRRKKQSKIKLTTGIDQELLGARWWCGYDIISFKSSSGSTSMNQDTAKRAIKNEAIFMLTTSCL
jgi:hypothetical protein